MFRKQGLSERVISILLKSWRSSTNKQYTSHILRWNNYVVKHDIDFFKPSVADVLEFLTLFFDSGCGYSALNTARSALSSFISVNNLPVGQNSLVKRFMKGAFNMKPSFPRYTFTWDVNLVLKFLKSMDNFDNITLKWLTFKLVMLVALVSGQRCQTLHCLNLDNLDIFSDKAIFHITELLKHSRSGVHLKPIELKRYSQDKDLCVVTALEVYIHRTAHLRDNNSFLFMAYFKPYNRASCNTISRWIKNVLCLSGINTDIFKAHSTRSAATSAAFIAGVPVADILKTAGWTSECTFAKYYNKPVRSCLGDAVFNSDAI